MVALATPVIEMQVTDQTKESVTEIVASTFPIMQVGNVLVTIPTSAAKRF